MNCESYAISPKPHQQSGPSISRSYWIILDTAVLMVFISVWYSKGKDPLTLELRSMEEWFDLKIDLCLREFCVIRGFVRRRRRRGSRAARPSKGVPSLVVLVWSLRSLGHSYSASALFDLSCVYVVGCE